MDKENYWKKKDFEDALKDKNAIFLVAEENKKILGYVNGFTCPTKKTDVMIHETRTDKRERGKKIGIKLVDAFCKEAFRRKAKDIYALIEPELERFYIKSCGFNKSHKWVEVKKSK